MRSKHRNTDKAYVSGSKADGSREDQLNLAHGTHGTKNNK